MSVATDGSAHQSKQRMVWVGFDHWSGSGAGGSVFGERVHDAKGQGFVGRRPDGGAGGRGGGRGHGAAVDDKDKVARADAPTKKREGVRPARGSWRGAGGPARNGGGAWMESADWAWKLSSDSAGLEMTVKKGKYLKAGVLRAGKAPGTFVFEATLADGTSRTFAGAAAGDRKPLVLTADAKAPAGGVRRVSITPLHDTGLLVLLEAENPKRHSFSRLGEVGYTARGSPSPRVSRTRSASLPRAAARSRSATRARPTGLLLRLPRPVQRRPRVGPRRVRRAGEGKGEKVMLGFR